MSVVVTDWEKLCQQEQAICDLSNLIAALQVLCFDLADVPIERGSELAMLRSAVLGVGKALEERVARA